MGRTKIATILLVDNDIESGSALRRALKGGVGHIIQEANVPRALDYLSQGDEDQRFHIILINLHKGMAEGLHLIKVIRGLSHYFDTPVILYAITAEWEGKNLADIVTQWSGVHYLLYDENLVPLRKLIQRVLPK